MLEILKKPVNYPFLVYLGRVMIGFLIGYSLIEFFPGYDFFWTLISIILVISPDEKDARRITIERVKSNFIGSLSGLMVFWLPIQDIFKIILGIIITILICQFFKLINVARTSVVALLIVLIERHAEELMTPIERFLQVALGCVIGLAVTLITSYFKHKIKASLR